MLVVLANKFKERQKMIINSSNLWESFLYDVERFALENFAVSESNAWAYEIVKDLMESAWEEPTILTLRSKYPGVGKRHLASALTTELLLKEPNRKLLYITEDDNVEEQDFNNADGLVVINLEKVATNELIGKLVCEKVIEFYKQGKYLILTYNCDKLEDIPIYGRMMANAIHIAKIAEIKAPEEVLCKRIINRWMKNDGIEITTLTESVIEKIIKQSNGSIREMEGRYNMEIAMLRGSVGAEKFMLDIEELINNEAVPIKTFYLPNWNAVVFLTDEEIEDGRAEGMEKLPDLEQLAPYNTTIGEFVSDMTIPKHMTASSYLRENSLSSEFRTYRMEKAKAAMKLWLVERGISLDGILKDW